MKKREDLLSKSDADNLLRFIQSCLFCNNEEELRQLVADLKNLFIHEYALCGYGKIERSAHEPYALLNVNYPASWVDAYVSLGLENRDPIVTENFQHYSLQYWTDTYRKHRDCKSFISNAEDCGLREGYSYGLKTYNGEKTSLFSFAGRSVERHDRTELILEYVIPHIHQAFARITENRRNKQSLPAPRLSSREKEVLRWSKDGKNTWEISVILSISADTVKFHIKNIMQKLEVVSRTQAVAAALELGLIGIE